MGGFFGFFDYSKPGPGVPKDGPPKARIIVFFEILQRKFWNLIKVNMMFNIFNIPAIILGMFASMSLFPQILPNSNLNTAEDALGDLVSRFVLLTVFLCVPLITVGPAQAGFTYVLRNYSREEHAFIWSDFKEHAMKNFKQSMIVCGIDFLLTCLMLYALKVYFMMNSSLLVTFATTLMIMIFIIFFLMHIYIYPMMVTFKLSTKQLYKNAIMFAIGKLLPNLGIFLLCILVLFLTFGLLIQFSPIIGFILYIFFTVSFIGMITNFYANGKIQKYMMPAEEADEDEDYEEDDSDEEEYDDNDESGADSSNESDQNEEEDKKDDSDDVKRYY